MSDVNGNTEAARIAGGAIGVFLWGYTLNEWVAILTIFYMILQIVILLPKICRGMHGWFSRLKNYL